MYQHNHILTSKIYSITTQPAVVIQYTTSNALPSKFQKNIDFLYWFWIYPWAHLVIGNESRQSNKHIQMILKDLGTLLYDIRNTKKIHSTHVFSHNITPTTRSFQSNFFFATYSTPSSLLNSAINCYQTMADFFSSDYYLMQTYTW